MTDESSQADGVEALAKSVESLPNKIMIIWFIIIILIKHVTWKHWENDDATALSRSPLICEDIPE